MYKSQKGLPFNLGILGILDAILPELRLQVYPALVRQKCHVKITQLFFLFFVVVVSYFARY